MALGEEMGGQVVSASINASTKAIEAMLKIIDRIFQLYKERSSPKYKLDKAQLNKLRLHEKYNGMYGYVAHEKLKKAGIPLTVANVNATEQQFQRICELCKKHGVLVSGVTDPTLDGKKVYTLEFKAEDARRIAAIVDFVNLEERANTIQNKIDEIMKTSVDGTLDGLSQEDQELVKALQNEIKSLQTQHTANQNREITENGIAQEFKIEVEPTDFFTCMNRLTDNAIKQPVDYYVVDTVDPDKYIECHSEPDNFHGKEYTHTQYKVYSHGELVLEADDGRFEGREKDFWKNLKEKMKEAGGFNDQVIRFNSHGEMQQYVEQYKAEQKREVEPIKEVVEKGSRDPKDYAAIQKHLEDKIKETGYELDPKNFQAVKDGKALTKEECCGELAPKDMDAKVRNCEAFWNAELYRQFEALHQLEEERALVAGQLFTETAGTVEHGELQAQMNVLENKIADTKADIQHGTIVLGKINAMQCDDLVKKSVIREFKVQFVDQLHEQGVQLDPLEEHEEDPRMSMDEWEKLIEKRKREREQGEDHEDRAIGRLEYIENGTQRSIEFMTAAAMFAELQNHPDITMKGVLYIDGNEPLVNTKDMNDISKACGSISFENVGKKEIDKDIDR